VKTSEGLELNEKETGVGRKGNPPIPDLEKTGKRKEVPKEDEKDDKEFLKEADLNDPIVMGIEGPLDPKSNWRQIEVNYKETFPDRKVIYTRYDKGAGQIIISSNKQDKGKLTEEFKVKLGDDEFIIKKLEGDKLDKFWTEHGNHYNSCANKKLSLSSTSCFNNTNRVKEEESGKRKT